MHKDSARAGPEVAGAPHSGGAHGSDRGASRDGARVAPNAAAMREGRRSEDTNGRGGQPANEMKPPTMVPYAMWAARLTSGVCGP
jgi:hypothetical protein